ncbi:MULTISPECIES: choice-of-anchor J domain-containing protein [unclassified Carboxylicivirga]|uniref:choice-of-anchor J domain-containing protein n=1 Tax=Carboxylicivirga TaxID=1628153 RepID=UPI003D3351AE
MKTITKVKQLLVLAVIVASTMGVSHAQTTMYSTNWNDGYENWMVSSATSGTVQWDNRGGGDGIQATNTQDTQSEEWIVSPEFDFSNGSTFTLSFVAAQADNGSPAGKLDVYYTENWGSDGTGATWTSLELDITNGYSVGWNGGAGYVSSSYVMPSTSATVRIAFKYTSEGWTDPNNTPEDNTDDENRNRIRVKDLTLTTSGSVTEWPLPYAAAWANDLEDWTVVSNVHATKEWAYKAAATVFMTDGKRDQDDWLISPKVICSSSKQKQISFLAGWKNFQSSNISLYYSTDYDGDQAAATWIKISENIIPDTHGFGFATSLLYSYSHTMDLQADAVTFAIQYAPYKAYGDSQNEIRIKNFKVEEATPTNLNDKELLAVEVYPNPTRDMLNISIDGKAHAEIYNLAGQLVKKAPINNKQVNVSELTVGQYIIMVKQDEKVSVTKFIKK